MMRNVTVSTIAAVSLLGCATIQPSTQSGAGPTGTETPPVASSTSSSNPQALAQVEQNLERLKALQIVNVGELVVDLPAEATNCYGPCPGFEHARETAKQKAAEQLATLVEQGEMARSKPTNEAACTPEAVQSNLDALRALRIVTVDGLVKVTPLAEGNCYGSCVEQAARETCHNASSLANLVETMSARRSQ